LASSVTNGSMRGESVASAERAAAPRARTAGVGSESACGVNRSTGHTHTHTDSRKCLWGHMGESRGAARADGGGGVGECLWGHRNKEIKP